LVFVADGTTGAYRILVDLLPVALWYCINLNSLCAICRGFLLTAVISWYRLPPLACSLAAVVW